MPRKGESAAPVGTITTEIQVPVFPLASRCSICKLFQLHPQQFEQATRMLMLGEEQQKVVQWLNKQPGIRVTTKALSRHYHRHMLPFFAEALELERRARAWTSAIDSETSGSIASALARSMAMQALASLEKISFDAIASEADPNTIREFSRLAETIAKIDGLAADRRLKEKLVQLRQIEVDLKGNSLDEVAARWILLRLQERPQVARQVIELLDLPLPPKELKALPAPSTETNAKPNRSRTQKTRRRGTRKKR